MKLAFNKSHTAVVSLRLDQALDYVMLNLSLITFAKTVYEMVVYMFERAFDLMRTRPQSIKYRFYQHPSS